jgi:hypothetical protein
MSSKVVSRLGEDPNDWNRRDFIEFSKTSITENMIIGTNICCARVGETGDKKFSYKQACTPSEAQVTQLDT